VDHAAPLDLTALWQHCLEVVAPAAASPVARQWLENTSPVGFSDDTIVLAAPHAFAREWLDLKLGQSLRDELSATTGRPIHVVITVQASAASLSVDGADPALLDPTASATAPSTAPPDPAPPCGCPKPPTATRS
jgi:chromosomal replication initiator protein